MILSLIAAMSENRVIGRGGEVPWDIPDDVARFKALTMGHPVVMGRKTYDSIGGVSLPGRTNVVLTRRPGFQAPGFRVARDLPAALEPYRDTGEEVFVVGGGEIYAAAMPLADRIFLTLVHLTVEGDAFFPKIPEDLFEMVQRRTVPDPVPHTFIDFVRKTS